MHNAQLASGISSARMLDAHVAGGQGTPCPYSEGAVASRSPDARPPMPDLRSSILDPRLLFLLEIVVIHLDAEDDDAAHCGDEVGPEDCEALAKDAKHNTLQHKGDAANANH